jgi:tricorn protease
VPRAGGSARRLTSFQGQTANPHFSPDGRWIAFSGEYAGNFDVYVVAAEGGEPKRLTWHPGADSVEGLDARRQVDRVLLGRATWAPSGAPRFWTVPAKAASKSRWRCRALTRERFPPTARASPIA